MYMPNFLHMYPNLPDGHLAASCLRHVAGCLHCGTTLFKMGSGIILLDPLRFSGMVYL